ncbi:DinB family protein, partial [Bacillus cereus]
LDKEAWSQRGNANNSEVTVRALAYIIAGHELHHLQIIKERYLGSDAYPAT